MLHSRADEFQDQNAELIQSWLRYFCFCAEVTRQEVQWDLANSTTDSSAKKRQTSQKLKIKKNIPSFAPNRFCGLLLRVPCKI
jgi:hypothetical protein